MSENMVERVARAIFTAHNSEQPNVSWDDDTKDWERDEYRAQARAAIEAMREPTEAMKVSALSATFDDKVGDRVYVGDVPIIWHAMIDAALKEQP